jgi:hypothetical protein
MSSRRCGYCFNYGHNRTTCEQFTAIYKRDAEVEAANNKNKKSEAFELTIYDRYCQQEYAKRIKADVLLDGTPYEGNRITPRSSSIRTCSYCGHSGHNRRRCEEFQKETVRCIEGTKAYRKALKKQITGSGWGIGALVKFREEVYMITSVNWSKPSVLTITRHDSSMMLTHINHTLPAYQRTRYMAFPPLENENVPAYIKKELEWAIEALEQQYDYFNGSESRTAYTLLSGVDTFDFPVGWEDRMVTVDEVEGLKKHLKDMQSSEKYENQWEAKHG